MLAIPNQLLSKEPLAKGHAVTTTATTIKPFSNIDMFTPAQTCRELGVADDVLLSMINSGQLAAFNLGGSLRLRVSDVQATAAVLAAA